MIFLNLSTNIIASLLSLLAQTEAQQQAVQGACAAALISTGYRDVSYGPAFEDEGGAGDLLIVKGRRSAQPVKTFLCRLDPDSGEAAVTQIPNTYKIIISDRGADAIQNYRRNDDEE